MATQVETQGWTRDLVIGGLDPDCIHLLSIYVDRLILGGPYDNKFEFKTARQREAA